MGKHERQEIEDLEKSVVLCLNGGSPSIPKGHKWYAHMDAFINYIKKKFPSYVDAEHTGNTYGEEAGDIRLTLDDRSLRHIELKASETPHGRGTLANISQNAITEYGLLKTPADSPIQSWGDYRKAKNFLPVVKGLLSSYGARSDMGFFEKASFIRERAAGGDTEAVLVKSKIVSYANQNKRDYINYIREFRSNEENIIKFIYCMLNGVHTKDEIRAFMAGHSLEALKKKAGDLITLYSNQQGSEVLITETSDRMTALIAHYDHFAFSFPESTDKVICTHIIGSDKQTGEEQRFIKLQLHWKNIFQGIKTPCINVFLGPFFDN